nr:MAG TPA: hypothetical protein [Caudoviricetes sp.]
MVFSGIFTRLAASIGNTRTRWESSTNEGRTVAGSLANVISVRSVTSAPFCSKLMPRLYTQNVLSAFHRL